MDNRLVHVPVVLLLDPGQTPSSKVTWMALQLRPTALPSELEDRTGLSRHTVLAGLAQAKARKRTPGGPRVAVPAALLTERTVGARAKIFYGLLQNPAHFRNQSGWFTYSSLATYTQFSIEALGTPEKRRGLAEAALLERHLRRATYGGTARVPDPADRLE